MAEKEIRNLSHVELTTDVVTKDGGRLIIMPYQVANLKNVDEKSLKASIENGQLKSMVDQKLIIVGTMIKGDAKEIEKLDGEESKKIEAKVSKKKKSKKED